jgi:molybdopterin converting factor small subunit
MSKIEQLELEAHREQLQADVRKLLDKYLAIAEWDVPEIDEPLAIRLIVTAVRQELDSVEKALADSTQP